MYVQCGQQQKAGANVRLCLQGDSWAFTNNSYDTQDERFIAGGGGFGSTVANVTLRKGATIVFEIYVRAPLQSALLCAARHRVLVVITQRL